MQIYDFLSKHPNVCWDLEQNPCLFPHDNNACPILWASQEMACETRCKPYRSIDTTFLNITEKANVERKVNTVITPQHAGT